MNQPKFSVNDRVIFQRGAQSIIFTIKNIHIDWSGPGYSPDNITYYAEEALELYQEPQKKKLYAYKYYEEVKFSYHEKPLWDSRNTRAPEYDIEYPLNHGSKE